MNKSSKKSHKRSSAWDSFVAHFNEKMGDRTSPLLNSINITHFILHGKVRKSVTEFPQRYWNIRHANGEKTNVAEPISLNIFPAFRSAPQKKLIVGIDAPAIKSDYVLRSMASSSSSPHPHSLPSTLACKMLKISEMVCLCLMSRSHFKDPIVNIVIIYTLDVTLMKSFRFSTMYKSDGTMMSNANERCVRQKFVGCDWNQLLATWPVELIPILQLFFSRAFCFSLLHFLRRAQLPTDFDCWHEPADALSYRLAPSTMDESKFQSRSLSDASFEHELFKPFSKLQLLQWL